MRCDKVLYEELQPSEFVERINALPVAYLPLGTLEWHGLHLPLGSDGIQSKGVFERIAEETGGIVLPMLFLGPGEAVSKDNAFFYGMDHLSFDEGAPQQLEGSAYYIPEEQFWGLLDVIMHNLSRAGFKAVIGHGHGPSTTAFQVRKPVFQERLGLITYNLWELGYGGVDGIQTDHAAANETSLVMALRPELVDIARLPSDGTPVGVWGDDPCRAASAARGSEIIEKNVRLISQKIKAIMSDLPKTTRRLDYHNAKNLLKG